uniref:Macaca fascicularis brain cDNA clone: QbsA-10384, similar to human kinesin family member 1B (KIF1B), transcript variant 1, mRNA, RefSeq: NM_015074.2 n=1 Tax=Macaca fascicularis TaxID=9541 RepID=I7GHP3_MACFA|nr:unnamed protein product [Macaca fascicularis]
MLSNCHLHTSLNEKHSSTIGGTQALERDFNTSSKAYGLGEH